MLTTFSTYSIMKVQMEPQATAPQPAQIEDAELKQRLLTTSVARVTLQRYAMRGMNATEAAALAGVSVATARQHYADPEFRRAVLSKVNGAFASTDAAFVERTKSLTEKLEEQAAASFDALVSMLSPETNGGREISDSLRFRIHSSFMDRHTETAPVSRGQFRIDPIELRHAAAVAAEMDAPIPGPNVVEMPKQIEEARAV